MITSLGRPMLRSLYQNGNRRSFMQLSGEKGNPISPARAPRGVDVEADRERQLLQVGASSRAVDAATPQCRRQLDD
ncbi:MAG TPA: hypothetical protein VFZ01_14475 [Geminicoccaceae bacterium]